MVRHYRSVDPYESVAESKKTFFNMALKALGAKVLCSPKRLLDVGCGYGHFLERAAAYGWQVQGVEIVPEAVLSANRRLPDAKIFLCDLKAAKIPAGSLHAVTMWDVLCHVGDPAAEIEECHRILAPGGIIGIRVRNVASQLWLCRCYYRLLPVWRKLGVKQFYVFHRYNFSRKSIEKLLAGKGFVNTSTHSSPLTTGDPYRYSPKGRVVGLGKKIIGELSDLVYRLTSGRAVIGPSLLVWAQKPHVPVRTRP